MFARGYLRHYAELLGEPLEEVTGRFGTLQEAATSPDLTAVPHLPQPAARARALAAGGWSRPCWCWLRLIWWAMGVESA